MKVNEAVTARSIKNPYAFGYTELYVWCTQENVKPKKISDYVTMRMYMSNKSKDLQPNIYNLVRLKVYSRWPPFRGIFPNSFGEYYNLYSGAYSNSRAHIVLTLETQ